MWKRTLIIKIAALALLIGLAAVCVSGGSSPKPHDWRTCRITEDGTVADCPLGSVLVGDPKQIGLDVHIRMVDMLCENQECRIVAVGIDGKKHLGKRTVKLNTSGNCRSTIVVLYGLDLEDIVQLQFQTRPSQQQIAAITEESKISNAARKRRLIDQACEDRLFESNYIN